MPVPTVATVSVKPAERSEGIPQSQENIDRAIKLNEELFDEAPVIEAEEEEEHEEVEPEQKETKPGAKTTVPEKKEVPGKEDEQEEEPEEEVSLDARIERALKEGFERVAPKAPEKKEDEVKLTPEQEDQLLGRWKPDEKFLELLDSDDSKTRLNAVLHMRDGIIKQALTMTNYLVDQAVSKVRGEVAPLAETHQKTSQERGREAFFQVYPALKGGEGGTDYSDFLRLAVEDLKAENYTAKSTGDMMKAIATRAEQRIKKFNPKFELGTPAAQTTKTKAKTTMPKQPVTSTGGGGGSASGTSSGKTGNRSSGTEVFE